MKLYYSVIISKSWIIFTASILLGSCASNETSKHPDKVIIDSTGSATQPSEPELSATDKFYREIEIWNKRSPFAYYKGNRFSLTDAKSKLIFNNIEKMSFDDIYYSDLQGGGVGFSYGDLIYEEFIFDTLNLSNAELEFGIKAILKKIQSAPAFQNVLLRFGNESSQPYRTDISYNAHFKGSILQLTTKILLSSSMSEVTYQTEKTETINLVESRLSDPHEDGDAIIRSLLPAAKNNKDINEYFIESSNSIGETNSSLYPGYLKTYKYSEINPTSGTIRRIKTETIAHNEDDAKKENPLERGNYDMDRTRFYSRAEDRILLSYLALIYNRLAGNHYRSRSSK